MHKPITSIDYELLLRAIVLRPPKGVRFCLQSGRSDLIGAAISTGNDISFDLTVRVKDVGGNAPPRFLGPFTQGPPDKRFVYVCSGTCAGQLESPWTRRAKIPLVGITWPLIRAAATQPSARLEARYEGTGKDGGPSCATVPLVDGGWRLIR